MKLDKNLGSYDYIIQANYKEAEEKYRIKRFIDKLFIILQNKIKE